MLLAVALVAVNVFFWLAQGGFAIPQALIDQFFGSNMIRAEVLVATPTGTQDWRMDRGVITAVSGTSVTLRERDGTVLPLQLDPNARVQGGRVFSVSQLRKRMRVTVLRDANGPVSLVQVER